MIGKIQATSVSPYQTANSAEKTSGKIQNGSYENSLPLSHSSLNKSSQITLSQEALDKLNQSRQKTAPVDNESASGPIALTEEEQKEVAQLQKVDQKVRAHELAHVMVGGNLVRKGASYQYELGPNGVRYAVSGEVSIDASPVEGDPAATITKMQKVKRAALAPVDPSPQDRAVAASASQKEFAARRELAMQSVEELD